MKSLKTILMIGCIALSLCISSAFADQLDELSSYCLGRTQGWARMKPCKIKKRHRYCRPKRKKKILVEVIPEVVELEKAILLYKDPRACFKKLLRPVQFAVDYLPPCFTVFANDQGIVSLHPAEGLEERSIPVVNLFNNTPGCYVACYSRNPDKAVYPVAPGIFMIGQIRVKGSYVSNLCIPKDYENLDIRGETAFKEMCSKSFSCIGNSCWAGPNTGNFFGLE